MKIIRNIFIGLAVLTLLGVVGFFLLIADFNPEPAQLELTMLNDTTLKAKGNIDGATAEQFLVALDAPNLDTLVITSGGGSVRDSVKIAQKIHERSLKLVVEDYCMSSCLNYFVPAAQLVTIREDSILGFHGSAETTADFLGPLGFLFGADIRPERAFLEQINKPGDMHFQLNDRRTAYVEQHGLDDVNFWMVGPWFFETFDVSLNPGSYFPESQAALDAQVARIKGDSDEELTLEMAGYF